MKRKKNIYIIVILILITSIIMVISNVFRTKDINSNNGLVYTEISDMKSITYLSDIEPNGYTSSGYYKDQDLEGNKLSLLYNGIDYEFDKGIFTHSYSSLFYTEIKEYGYEYFSAYIGINKSARDQFIINNNYAKVEFKVYADGKLVYSSGVMTSQDDYKYVEIALNDVSVLQLVVDSLGATSYDHAVWANAAFYKQDNTPYLKVSDLEFNLNTQVTKSNILDYVEAKDSDGTDITEKVTYTTNFQGEEMGNFYVTYEVEGSSGIKRTRTINMIVTGEDYTQELSLERLKKPWASYLYYGRSTLSEQGKKAWDIVLKEILDFHPEKWQVVNRYNEECYLIDIDLPANNVYVTQSELASLGYMFMDDEARTFIVKDWNVGLTQANGMVSHVQIWVNKGLGDSQDEWLLKIEENSQKFLQYAKSDMDEAQKMYYVLTPYGRWLQYKPGQLLHNALGQGESVCGGNARGVVYLTERLGIKSIFVRTNNHAWTLTKLSDYDGWFANDLLGKGILRSSSPMTPDDFITAFGTHAKRHYKWMYTNDGDYPRVMLNYPSVWINLKSDNIVLAKESEYNLKDYIKEYGSVYNSQYDINNIDITIDKIDIDGNIIVSNIKSIPIEGDGTLLKSGNYKVTYTIKDRNRTNQNSTYLRIADGIEHKVSYDEVEIDGGVFQESLGLFNGTEEVMYDNALAIYDKGNVSINIEDKNYRYLSFAYGIKDSVRLNTNYGKYGKVQVRVLFDEEEVYISNILGWQDQYITINLEIPEGVKMVTIESLNKGSGNNHAGLANLKFIIDNNTTELTQEELDIINNNNTSIGDIKENEDNYIENIVVNVNEYIDDLYEEIVDHSNVLLDSSNSNSIKSKEKDSTTSKKDVIDNQLEPIDIIYEKEEKTNNISKYIPGTIIALAIVGLCILIHNKRKDAV